jgi:hypothetical protein
MKDDDPQITQMTQIKRQEKGQEGIAMRPGKFQEFGHSAKSMPVEKTRDPQTYAIIGAALWKCIGYSDAAFSSRCINKSASSVDSSWSAG